MSNSSQIRYLTQQQIDKVKWDACMAASANELIYGYSFYLDCMARQWDALVLNDYEAIMPLTWNKKHGVRYLYQPPFTQQLGIFSKSCLPEDVLPAFIQAIKTNFRFAEIFLNFGNAGNELITKTNFILSLAESYQTISSRYTKDGIKNTRRSEKFDLKYSAMNDPVGVIELYKKMYGSRTKHVKEKDYGNFQQLCLLTQKKNMLIIRKVTGPDNELHATALLLQQNKRLYLLQSVTLPAGRLTEANYFLLNNIIKEFCLQDLVLDFEGSDIAGIAHFYKNFGAVNQPYFFFKYNRLPRVLRFFK